MITDPAIVSEPLIFVDLATKLGAIGILAWGAFRLSKWLPEYMATQEKRYDSMLTAQGTRHDTLIETFKSEAKAERDECRAQFQIVMQHSSDARDDIIEEVRRERATK